MIRSNDTLADELLTREELASEWKLKSHTLACWATQGKGPPLVKFGSGRSAAVRYRRSEALAWLNDPARAEAEAGEPWRAARRQAAARARAAAADKATAKKTRPAARRRRSRA